MQIQQRKKTTRKEYIVLDRNSLDGNIERGDEEGCQEAKLQGDLSLLVIATYGTSFSHNSSFLLHQFVYFSLFRFFSFCIFTKMVDCFFAYLIKLLFCGLSFLIDQSYKQYTKSLWDFIMRSSDKIQDYNSNGKNQKLTISRQWLGARVMKKTR